MSCNKLTMSYSQAIPLNIHLRYRLQAEPVAEDLGLRGSNSASIRLSDWTSFARLLLLLLGTLL